MRKNIPGVLLVPLLIGVFAVIGRILHYANFLNCDVALSLQEADLLLHGKLPYVDFINIQIPTYYVLFVPLVYIYRLTNLPPALCSSLFVLLLILYCLICSLMIVRHSKSTQQELANVVIFSTLIFNLPIFSHFGQKEHIFVLTFLPYFLMRWLRQEGLTFGSPLTVVAGGVAAAGLALKPPYFLIVAAAIESYWYWATKNKADRLRDPEFVTCTSLLLFYALCLTTLFLSSVQALHWIPFIIRGYGAYSQPVHGLLLQMHSFFPSIWLVLLMCTGIAFICREISLVVPLAIWTAAGCVICVAQAQHWSYQAIPMGAGFFMLANLELYVGANWFVKQLYDACPLVRKLWGGPVLTFTIYICILCPIIPWLVRDSMAVEWHGVNGNIDLAMAKYTHKNDSVLLLSEFPNLAYPAIVQTARRPASRYLWGFPIKMCEFLKCTKSGVEKETAERSEEKIIREICDDVATTKPSLIAISFFYRKDPLTRIWPVMESHGFERALADYTPLSFWNKNFIWLRKKHKSET
jgi:hypothetical protein